ncbi:DoxX family protein [Paenibacillus larvae]|uniref:Oxidoreductase CatD n=1 Tax=Paenibacillus larvae subsp. larvae DSM 25430 TaxID=697284 RepID=V9W6G2_9BACL|nr:DoxX family protein [Paenibacillus larvae]AHD05733.1 hypothetical protein ERIC2_c19380 [Paenibacillus larvae subsp. larvae DSM 25430]AVG12280.1 Putative oxidoreductase CatD [Paenibacillus larvae subsp. larvae DSM 25430]MDR5569695.1 DoxX family protein [Paenibacillus larvae]MDR5596018.1 DoxX family protein [Paenibacillus larvae]
MMKKVEVGALILRLFLGIGFFIHGLAKFQGGISNTVSFFDSLGIPGFIAYITAVIELVGGIAMILGLGTRVFSVLFALVMVGAIWNVKLAAGFVGGYELDLSYLAIAIYLAIAGSSLYALDSILFRTKK